MKKRRARESLCEWHARNLAENSALGLDTCFSERCQVSTCAAGWKLKGVIALNGDKKRLLNRTETLLKDSGIRL